MNFNLPKLEIPTINSDALDAIAERVEYEDSVKEDTLNTNKMMRRWTIAIGIMTAVMLLVTIMNVVLFIVRG
jgi:hypothetical protein